MSFEMEAWLNVCRCCLTPDAAVSILDSNENIKAKFLEATAIEVSPYDKLPQRLCNDCMAVLNTAHDFRTQCQKMDKELRAQLISNHPQVKVEYVPPNEKEVSEDVTEECMKKLQSIIKSEPMDDDDCYYVLVIDDKDDSTKTTYKPQTIKMEVTDTDNNDKEFEDNIVHQETIQDFGDQIDLENTINSFLLSNNKVPTSVPATILENEEGHETEVVLNNNIENCNIVADNTYSKSPKVTIADGIKEFNPKNLIKIVTPYGVEKTILLENEDVNYNAENQEESYNNDEEVSQEEIILCEGDDTSQFQILKVDGSEFVIEYADEGQITTVLQQEDGTFLCDCGEQFDDIQQFQKHQYKHNPAGEHLCNLCGKGFESAEILTGHTLLHRSSGPLVACPFCSQLIRRNALTQHIKYTHNSKPQCTVCNKTFANQNNLKRHMMIHSGIKEFECDICFKRFNQKITMQTHRLTHINSTTCYLCDTIFEDRAALAHHKEANECPKSKVKNVRDELIKTVRQTVTTNLGKVLGYACSLCKKMFSLESALDQHIESTHIVDEIDIKKEDKQMKRFECSMCGKRCASQAMLIMHERVHTNERPFPCQLCTLRFKTKTHLRTHQLTHTREKKFGCSVCMKFFALKGNLVVHLRTHTGERPYVCSLCNEAFIDSKYLKKHKLRKHSIENAVWNEY
ncbi:unnamed protein product [Pieris macdunnoughi]|uniref:Zinc finger protein n=2 Tax=Pieris macdunnoughi TaxID=345717 RepID=A0A821SNE9_9NEOP|nr:unnamed protein product [Pieris macdunnoughi]